MGVFFGPSQQSICQFRWTWTHGRRAGARKSSVNVPRGVADSSPLLHLDVAAVLKQLSSVCEQKVEHEISASQAAAPREARSNGNCYMHRPC